MPRLAITLLGPPRIERGHRGARDGEPVQIGRRKAVALLAYLVVERRSHSRDALATLLWPEHSQSRARAYLRRALSELNRAVEEGVLALDREVAGLDPEAAVWLDVYEFRERLAACGALGHPATEACPDCLSALEEAVDLHRDDFMAGFTLRDSLAFDEWQYFQRKSLRDELAGALERLVRGYSSKGQYDRAVDYARRWLALDPLHEAVQRHLMQLYNEAGQRSAALRQYDECVRILETELGLPPAEATTALYEQIRSRSEEGGALLSIAQQPAITTRPQHNLPAQSTHFVGRETELSEIAAMLAAPSCRLLTLTGPGGSGKTRLALEVALVQLDAEAYEHGVFLVSLAPLKSANAVVPAVADALGFQFYDTAGAAEGTHEQQLLRHLHQRNVLLLMDNYEHLLPPPERTGGVSPPLGQFVPRETGGIEGEVYGGAHLVSEILKSAPGVKILATSRARLNLQSEHTFAVAGLDVPHEEIESSTPGWSPADKGKRDQETAGFEAVELFVSSAHRHDSSFEPTGATLQDVVRVCRLVRGMPLGIVLAAAWVEVLPPGEIADEIRESLDLLETDMRDVPDRQRSMRATLDYSWHLLAEPERAVMQALSVFSGSFSRHAAHYVSGASLRELRSLMDKSLLEFVPRSKAQTGTPLPDVRYELHELLRQYAREKLNASPEAAAAAHERHCAYYTDALRRWGADLKGARQGTALAEMRADRENARAAWDWAVQRRQVARLDHAVEGLCRFFDRRGRWQEGVGACRAAAEALSATEKQATADQMEAASIERIRVLGKVLTWQGVFTFHLGHTEIARQLLLQGLDLLAELVVAGTDSRADQAWALFFLSAVTTHSGDDAEAARLREQSLALYRAAGDEWGTALLLGVLSLSARDSGAYDKAKRLAEESLALRRAISDAWGTANALHVLGWIAHARGEHDEAERLFREGVVIHQEKGHRGMDSVGGLNALSSTLIWLGRFREALSVTQEALVRCKNTGNRNQSPFAYRNLGEAKLHLGHYAEARAELQNGLDVLQETGETKFLVATLATLGEVALALGTYPEVCEVLEERITLAGEVEGWRVNYELTVGLSMLAYAAHSLSQPIQAQEYLTQALPPAIKTQNAFSLIHALSAAALMLAESAESAPVRAVELYALASRYPHVANSRWYEDVVGKRIASVAETMAPDVVAAAQERGRARDMWATAEELLVELEKKRG